ncbi:MAG: hypothetical protein BWY31_04627 [Lentisphaerae bacterium ADurb.Bin242]|nr:MAG: hypothetical protein BWY31_04627 [Lentisphaerae bacterium ADurb.Bin242]
MSEAEKKKSLCRKILLSPATWLALFWCLLAFVFAPLLEHPEMLYSLLPTSVYDAWEEFAVLHLEGWIVIAGLFFLVFSLELTLVSLFSRKVRGWKKAGKTLLYFFFAFLWLLFAIPMTGRARERAKRISCTSNLKQIHMGLEQYAGDYEGFLPPDLKTLQESGYLTDFEVFRCPSRLRPNAEFSDYLYFGKGRKLKAPPFLLVRDRDKNHPGLYWNNLFSNGQIQHEPEERKP